MINFWPFFVVHICSASASSSVWTPRPPVKDEKCKMYIKCSSAREMSVSGPESANKKWTRRKTGKTEWGWERVVRSCPSCFAFWGFSILITAHKLAAGSGCFPQKAMATALLGEGGFSSRLPDNIDRLRPDGFGGSIHAADHGHYKLKIKDIEDSQALKWRLG